jgi:hypothetical protein
MPSARDHLFSSITGGMTSDFVLVEHGNRPLWLLYCLTTEKEPSFEILARPFMQDAMEQRQAADRL